MRASPAVSYPLKRSLHWGRLWLAGALLSVAILAAWLMVGAGSGASLAWRLIVTVGIGAACWLSAYHAITAMPQGALHWDGARWSWQSPSGVQVYPSQAQVLIDGQSWMLVRFAGQQQGTQYFLLQRNWQPHSWSDLRRAVYSLPYSPQSSSTDTFS